MGIELILRGEAKRSLGGLFGAGKPLLDRVAEWLTQHHPEPFCRIEKLKTNKGNECLLVRLHPCQIVEIVSDGPRAVSVEAKTNTVGPGYHTFLNGLFATMGDELKIKWSAARECADIFLNPDASVVEMRMLGWLGQVASQMLTMREQGCTQLGLNMSTDFEFLHDGLVATPMGPRDELWLERTAANPRLGMDIFPWRGEMDAEFVKNWAEALMWTELRWRKPLTELEQRDMTEACQLLAFARKKDPDLNYPWREWLEMLDYLGLEYHDRAGIEKLAAQASGPLVGYRRRSVIFSALLPWTIKIPGDFAYESDENGHYLFNEKRQVQVSTLSYGMKPGHADPLSIDTIDKRREDPPGTQRLEHHTDSYQSYAYIFPDSIDDNNLRMQSACYCPGNILFSSYNYDPGDSEWALNAWHAIELHPLGDAND